MSNKLYQKPYSKKVIGRLVSLLFIMLAMIFVLCACTNEKEKALEKQVIWSNKNIEGVENKPLNPTFIELEQDCFVAVISNYHYFNNGAKPGTIELIGEDGKRYGPWQSVGRDGQGNVKNAYWDAFPNIELKKGKYQVIDSDPDTWSQNKGSLHCGHTEVRGSRLQNK